VVIIERLVFHRREDPSNEYRELLLCEEGHLLAIWEVIGFLTSETGPTHTRIDLGKAELQMRARLEEEATRLCEEGFTRLRCEPNRITI